MQITIHGQCPSKKNSRRPYVRAGRIMNFPSKKHEEWVKGALWELKQYKPMPKGRVKVDYMFYVQDLRKRDIDNMMASINDALVKAGIIEEDDWRFLKVSGADAMLDRDNPRAEIELQSTKNIEV